MAFRGSSKKLFEKIKRDLNAVRVVSIEQPVSEGEIGSVRLRDIWFEAEPVRSRLKRALESSFVISDNEETRIISIIKRKK